MGPAANQYCNVGTNRGGQRNGEIKNGDVWQLKGGQIVEERKKKKIG